MLNRAHRLDGYAVHGFEIAAWGAGVGLLLLALSPLFKWINFAAGGVTGLSGPIGKIVLGITLVAMAVYITAMAKQKWLTPVCLGVQALGTLAVFWMGTLIWKIGSILDSPGMKDNPLAALIATQISPGAGLYLGLIGGIAVAGALGYIAVRHLFGSGSLKPYYATQGLSCVLGILLAFFVGPGHPSKYKSPLEDITNYASPNAHFDQLASKERQKVREVQSSNNLKQMALAIYNYNDSYNTLPPAAIGDPLKPEGQRRPLLSWRVAILPFIERQFLYNQFKLDEPWDSPNNKPLLAKMPKVYQLPDDDKTPPDHTHYQVFVGNDASFEKTRGFKIPQDFTDGARNTILIATVEQAVPWTKPDDVAFDPSRPIVPLLRTYFASGPQFVLVDGSVRTLSQGISEKKLKAAITRNGNEPLGGDW